MRNDRRCRIGTDEPDKPLLAIEGVIGVTR